MDEPPPLARRQPQRPVAGSGGVPDASRAYRRIEAGGTPHLHQDHRMRVRRRRSEHQDKTSLLNKLLWLGLAAVIGLYGIVLAYTVLKGRHKSPLEQIAAAPAPEEAKKPAREPTYNNNPRPIEDDIKAWKQALTLTKEGGAQLDAEHLGPAEERLRKAAESAPDLTMVHLELAQLLEKKQDYAGAESEWRAALARDPENVAARLQLAAVFMAGGQPANALETARWAIEADPYSEEGHQIAAAALTALQQPHEAITHLRRLVTSNHDDLVAQNNLGVAYLSIKDYRNALSTFREVLRVDPGNSVAFYNLAVCYARQVSAVEAVDVLMQAARKFGAPFVLAWTQSPDFDPIRQEAVFQRFVEQGAEVPLATPAETAELTESSITATQENAAEQTPSLP